MKKLIVLFGFVFVLFSCNNPYVQDVLYGPAEADNLAIIADDGNSYALEQNPGNEREYMVKVPAMTEKFTIQGFARKGGAVAYSYSIEEPLAVEGNPYGYTYSGAFSAESRSGQIDFVPGTGKLKYLETIVIKVRVTQKYMEETVYTVVVHRGIDTLLWNLKLEQKKQNQSAQAMRSYPAYDKESRLNILESNGNPSSAYDDWDDPDSGLHKTFVILTSPDAEEMKFHAYLRKNTCIQYAIADSQVVDTSSGDSPLVFGAPNQGGSFVEDNFHHALNIEDYEIGLSEWENRWVYIRVWHGGDDLSNPNPPPPAASGQNLKYEEYAVKLRETTKFTFTKSDRVSLPQGTTFELYLGSAGSVVMDVDAVSDPSPIGYVEPEKIFTFMMTPPIGIKWTALVYTVVDASEKPAKVLTVETVPVKEGVDVFSYVMPPFDSVNQYDTVQVRPIWNWSDKPSDYSGITNVRFVRPGGPDYTPAGTSVTPPGPDGIAGTDDDGEPRTSGDAATWGTATGDLQGLIDSWQDGCGWDEIWIAKGTISPYWIWAEDGNYDDMPRTMFTEHPARLSGNSAFAFKKPLCWSFVLRDGVSIYGGFAGNETAMDQKASRNVAANKTILSGDMSAYNSINALHVVTARGLTGPVTLEGVTITGGQALAAIPAFITMPGDGDNTGFINRDNQMGAGIFITNCEETGVLTLKNVTITDNVSMNMGGGVFIYKASPVFEDCLITGNSGSRGGGVTIQVKGSAAFNNTTVTSNQAADRGGGLYLGDVEQQEDRDGEAFTETGSGLICTGNSPNNIYPGDPIEEPGGGEGGGGNGDGGDSGGDKPPAGGGGDSGDGFVAVTDMTPNFPDSVALGKLPLSLAADLVTASGAAPTVTAITWEVRAHTTTTATITDGTPPTLNVTGTGTVTLTAKVVGGGTNQTDYVKPFTITITE
jgi:hypothetical protein